MSYVMTGTRQPDGPYGLEMAGARRSARSDEASARRGRSRSDSLPEYTRYRDDGCDIHSHCLSCPLPRCRYEEPGGLRALLNQRRDRQIVALRLKGVPVEDLADRFSVSRRTVFRVLESRRVALRPLARPAPPVVRLADRAAARAAREQRREAFCA